MAEQTAGTLADRRASTRLLSLDFWLVVGAAFVGLVGVGATVPALPPHVRHDLGRSDLAVGVLVGLFSVSADRSPTRQRRCRRTPRTRRARRPRRSV